MRRALIAVACGSAVAFLAGGQQGVAVAQGAATKPRITNLPARATFGTHFTAKIGSTSAGPRSLHTSSSRVCVAEGLRVTFLGVGTCSLVAKVGRTARFDAATGAAQVIAVHRATATTPVITGALGDRRSGDRFTVAVATNGDGRVTVSSSTPSICTAHGLVVRTVAVGTCVLTPAVAEGPLYIAVAGGRATFKVQENATSTPRLTKPAKAPASPSSSSIANLPRHATRGGGMVATIKTNADGEEVVLSATPAVCVAHELVVTFRAKGVCRLTSHVGRRDGVVQAIIVGRELPPAGSLPDTGGVTLRGSIVPAGPRQATASLVCARPLCSGYVVLYSDGLRDEPDAGVAVGLATYTGPRGDLPISLDLTPAGQRLYNAAFGITRKLQLRHTVEGRTTLEVPVQLQTPTVPRQILFGTGSVMLDGNAQHQLAVVATRLQESYPDVSVALVGHADSTASTAKNQELARGRAEAVAAELRRYGVTAARLTISNEGELRPVASNAVATGRARNRRVEIARL